MTKLKAILSAIGEVARKNRQVVVTLAVALAACIAFFCFIGAVSSSAANRGAGDEEGAATAGAADEGGESDSADGSNNQSDQGQTRRWDSAADEKVAQTLEAYSWTQGSVGVAFGQDGVAGLSQNKGDWSVSDAQEGKPEGVEGQAPDVYETKTTFILTVDGTQRAASLTASGDSDGQKSLELTCQGLFSGPLAASSSAEVALDQDYPALASYVDAAALRQALTSWRNAHAPRATRASWDGIASVDTNSGTTTLTFAMLPTEGTTPIGKVSATVQNGQISLE